MLAGLAGCVWELVVPGAELAELRRRHLVSGTLRRGDGVQARVIAGTAPGAGARPATPSLEDAYLDALARVRAGGSA
jgi:ABC-2 type transport system ATP-binding protein